MSWIVLPLFLLAGFWAARNLMLIVPEGCVVKTYVLGKFDDSYGPGMHVGWFDKRYCRQIRLSVGMVGVAVSEQAAELSGLHMPVLFSCDARVGDPVRIERFEGTGVVVTHGGVPIAKVFRCEKCGHINSL